jgi:hypothetical protein
MKITGTVYVEEYNNESAGIIMSQVWDGPIPKRGEQVIIGERSFALDDKLIVEQVTYRYDNSVPRVCMVEVDFYFLNPYNSSEFTATTEALQADGWVMGHPLSLC